MFTIKENGKTITFRNLEEQVKYLTDYHTINQGIAQWGIRVVGQVDTAEELPDPATYTGEFGDTYAVGTEAPFNFYIWTRASQVGESNYWFPFGEISIVGPRGPQGKQGPKGEDGIASKWLSGSGNPVFVPANKDDYYLKTDGSVYKNAGGVVWNYVTNIKGPQGTQGPRGEKGADGKDGEQGPQGPQGDVGGFINIWGILTSEDLLPIPTQLNNLTVAYLVKHTGGTDQANDHYDLYIQVGETSSTATWNNVGPFNVATLVTVGGAGQNVWDADTKLDVSASATEGAITQKVVTNKFLSPYYVDHIVKVGLTTNTQTLNTEEKTAACNLIGALENKVPTRRNYSDGKLVGFTENGDLVYIQVFGSATQYSIPLRDINGCIKTSSPQANNDAANKAYVDTVVANSGTMYLHSVSCGTYSNFRVQFNMLSKSQSITSLIEAIRQPDFDSTNHPIITPIHLTTGSGESKTCSYIKTLYEDQGGVDVLMMYCYDDNDNTIDGYPCDSGNMFITDKTNKIN